MNNTPVELPWEVAIRRTNNGFIVTKLEDIGDEDGIVIRRQEHVFEDTADTEFIEELEGINVHRHHGLDQQIAMYSVLYQILEEFGVYRSKHNKINLEITFNVEKDEEEEV